MFETGRRGTPGRAAPPRVQLLVQVRAMLFCHLGRAQSCARLRRAWPPARQVRHLGLPGRAHAFHPGPMPMNRGRGAITAGFYQMPGRCSEGRLHVAVSKNKSLTWRQAHRICASVFEWAQLPAHKRAVKRSDARLIRDCSPSLPLITEGRVHESRWARSFARFEPGNIVVFDRGYADYDPPQLVSLTRCEGGLSSTAMKDNGRDYRCRRARYVPETVRSARRDISFIKRPERGKTTCFW